MCPAAGGQFGLLTCSVQTRIALSSGSDQACTSSTHNYIAAGVQVGLLTDVPQPYLSGIIGGGPEAAQSVSRASAYIAHLPGLEQQHGASTAHPAEEGAAPSGHAAVADSPADAARGASNPLAAAAGVAAGDNKGSGKPSPQSSHEFMFDTTDLEEQHADMLLSVAGTVQGLTALQMHVRAQGGIELQHLLRGLQLARPARLQKLRAMGSVAAKVIQQAAMGYPSLEHVLDTSGASRVRACVLVELEIVASVCRCRDVRLLQAGCFRWIHAA